VTEEQLIAQVLAIGWEGLRTRYGPCEGYLYIVQTESKPSFIKIGFSRSDPRLCMAALQTGNHRHLKIVTFCAGCRRMEKALHDACREHRTSGERFFFQPVSDTILRLLEERGEEEL
jgi:hypothetical protein